jgi:hypothetical protein
MDKEIMMTVAPYSRTGMFMALCMAAACFGNAQIIHSAIGHLDPALHKKFDVDYTPFGSVTVLDNRPDTSKFYFAENGDYPPTAVGFDTTASVAIRQYLEGLTSYLKKGQIPLIINLRQLYIPNQRFILRRVEDDRRIFGIPAKHDSTTWAVNARNYIWFVADIYYRSDDLHYRKIFTYQYQFYFLGYNYIRPRLEQIFGGLLEVAGTAYGKANGLNIGTRKLYRIIKDSSYYKYDPQQQDMSFAAISQKAGLSWAAYPILQATNLRSGLYRSFDDFKNNKITDAPIHLLFDVKDSVYRIQGQPKDSSALNKNWAVCDGNFLYFKIGGNTYLRLSRTDSGFFFFVPWSMPDMYAVLSIMEEEAVGRSGIAANSNSLFANLAAAAVAGVVDGITIPSRTKKIFAEGLKHDFRRCYIDMDTGDILYSQDTAMATPGTSSQQ